MNKKLCRGNRGRVEFWVNAGENSIHHMDARSGMRPSNIKRKKVKCPQCNRRVLYSIKPCDDGCCVGFVIPPHKPKGWWRKKKKVSKKKRGRR